MGTERCTKGDPITVEEDDGNPYKENIIGQWKLLYVTSILDTLYVDDDIIRDSINYSAGTIIYDFRPENKLIITGYVEGDLQPGEHYYEYIQNNVCFLCSPGPNLIIDDERMYCDALKNGQTMTIGGETKIGWVIDDSGQIISGCTKSWEKYFMKLN
jgi:hypothetical protein